MASGQRDAKVKALCKLYDQAFWLSTVVIALAIGQVLIEIIPRFLNYFFTTELPLPTPEFDPSAFYIEVVRSLVFLIVITRFFLGGVLVFTKLTQNSEGPPKGSWVHVLTAFVHFLLFFGWAYTAFVTAVIWRVSLFIGTLMLILLWDIAWYWLSPGDQRPGIRPWLYRNVRTVIYLALIFFGTGWFLGPHTQETVMLLMVLVISGKDFWEMFTKHEPPPRFLAIL